jgi:hypothetical protein
MVLGVAGGHADVHDAARDNRAAEHVGSGLVIDRRLPHQCPVAQVQGRDARLPGPGALVDVDGDVDDAVLPETTGVPVGRE